MGKETDRLASFRSAVGLAWVLALAPSEAAQGGGIWTDRRESYSYFRTLEGIAWVTPSGRGPGGAEQAEVHRPVLSGDRVELGTGSRAELLLADRTRAYLGSDTRIVLEQVAFSADSTARTTRLELVSGELVLRVPESALGDELPVIGTPAGRIYLQDSGNYRIRWGNDRGLELTVRRGWAELLTSKGSMVVRESETARFVPHRSDLPEVLAAGPSSTLERWQREIESGVEGRAARVRYVEPELSYAAAMLDSYGTWVLIDSSWYWRPTVGYDWRPYWNGRWHWTPSGYLWVGYDPWGWVPDHYGTWVYHPRWGWCWRPGSVFAPAWVYWSWGPTWTGWCPIGLYVYDTPWMGWRGFRFGIYGWARTSWSVFVDWTFVPTRWVCSRDWTRHRRYGREMAHRQGRDLVEGVITTDSRPLPPERLDRPEEIPALFRREVERSNRPWLDVTDFVSRNPELNDRLRKNLELPRDRIGDFGGTPLLIEKQGHTEAERSLPTEHSGWTVWRSPELEVGGDGNKANRHRPALDSAPDQPRNEPFDERQGWRLRSPQKLERSADPGRPDLSGRPVPRAEQPLGSPDREMRVAPRPERESRGGLPVEGRQGTPRSERDSDGLREEQGPSEPVRDGRISPGTSETQGWKLRSGRLRLEDPASDRESGDSGGFRPSLDPKRSGSDGGSWSRGGFGIETERTPIERVLEGVRRHSGGSLPEERTPKTDLAPVTRGYRSLGENPPPQAPKARSHDAVPKSHDRTSGSFRGPEALRSRSGSPQDGARPGSTGSAESSRVSQPPPTMEEPPQ